MELIDGALLQFWGAKKTSTSSPRVRKIDGWIKVVPNKTRKHSTSEREMFLYRDVREVQVFSGNNIRKWMNPQWLQGMHRVHGAGKVALLVDLTPYMKMH